MCLTFLHKAEAVRERRQPPPRRLAATSSPKPVKKEDPTKSARHPKPRETTRYAGNNPARKQRQEKWSKVSPKISNNEGTHGERDPKQPGEPD